jgi:pimeloyl-ACP methyl ester carboxylesterase
MFVADNTGSFDTERSAAIEGSYVGIDPSGLFWSMTPEGESDLDAFRLSAALATASGAVSSHGAGFPTFTGDEPIRTQIDLTVDGVVCDSRTLTRLRIPENISEELVVDGGLHGSFFSPQGGSDSPAVVFLSGSEGGVKRHQAAQLAARGFNVLALAYFNGPGVPKELNRVPLEYFLTGMNWLRRRTDQSNVALVGGSRGGEAVLAIGSLEGQGISAIVAMVPGDMFTGTHTMSGDIVPAWTHNGIDLPVACGSVSLDDVIRGKSVGATINTANELFSFYSDRAIYDRCSIPVEGMKAPILFISGAKDECWPSHISSLRAIARLRRSNYRHDIEHVWDPDAGHLVGFPGLPTTMTEKTRFPGHSLFLALGGSPEANARHQRRSWEATVEFLVKHTKR